MPVKVMISDSCDGGFVSMGTVAGYSMTFKKWRYQICRKDRASSATSIFSEK